MNLSAGKWRIPYSAFHYHMTHSRLLCRDRMGTHVDDTHLEGLLGQVGAVLGQGGRLVGATGGSTASHTGTDGLLGLSHHADDLSCGQRAQSYAGLHAS